MCMTTLQYLNHMIKNMTEKEYFKPREVKLELCQCDVDILLYVMNHIDWSEHVADDYGGEGVDAACIHLDDIENLLIEYTMYDQKK